MLREFEAQGRIVVADLEAGVGTLLRMGEHGADLAIVVTQPTAKSMEVARRGLLVAASRSVPAILVANRVTGDGDLALITQTIAPSVPVLVVPDDPLVARADEEGVAPLDATPAGAGVAAVAAIARRVAELASARPQAS